MLSLLCRISTSGTPSRTGQGFDAKGKIKELVKEKREKLKESEEIQEKQEVQEIQEKKTS